MSFQNGNNPPAGSHFGDGVRTGPIFGSRYVASPAPNNSPIQVNIPTDGQTPGVYNTPTTLLDIIPAPVDTACLFPFAPLAAAGNVPLLQTSNVHFTYLAQVKTNTAIYTNVLQLDCARNITVGSLSNTFAGTYITVFGLDQYLMPMSERILVPYVVDCTINGLKAFSYVYRATISAATNGLIAIGVGNTFGLPYYLSAIEDGLVPMWNGSLDNNTLVKLSGAVPITFTATSNIISNITVAKLPGMEIAVNDTIGIASAATNDSGFTYGNLNSFANVVAVTQQGNNYIISLIYPGVAANSGTSQGGNGSVMLPYAINSTISYGTFSNGAVSTGNFPFVTGFVPGVRALATNQLVTFPLSVNPLRTINGVNVVGVYVPNASPSFYVPSGATVILNGLQDTGGVVASALNNTAGLLTISASAGSSGNYFFSVQATTATGSILAGGGENGYITIPSANAVSTGDVRGTYTPTTLADGTKRLLISYYSPSGDSRNYNAAGQQNQYLCNIHGNANPFATNAAGSGRVNVYAAAHNFIDGDTVSFAGVLAFDGISAGNLTAQSLAVTVIDQNNFYVNTPGSATAGGIAGGGSNVLMTPAQGSLYLTPNSRYGNVQA